VIDKRVVGDMFDKKDGTGNWTYLNLDDIGELAECFPGTTSLVEKDNDSWQSEKQAHFDTKSQGEDNRTNIPLFSLEEIDGEE